MEYTYKYLHVLFFNDIKFYQPLVKILDETEELKPTDHFFITDQMRVYESLRDYKNVRLVKQRELYKYMRKSKWIILHSMPLKKWQVILMPNSICGRIIWRTWGHDIRPVNKGLNIFDSLRRLVFSLYRKKVEHFFAIGIANEIDIVNAEEVFCHKFRYFKLNYTDCSEEIGLIQRINPISNDKKKYILVGHNCSPVDNHLKILDKLTKFKNEEIHLIIPLSYSDPQNGYKEQVIEKAYRIFGEDNVTILKDFMPHEEYIRLISKIDIAIMDMYYSNALGNVQYILYFKKKLYVCKNGNMDKAFLLEGIKPNYTRDIENQSFEEFVRNDYDDRYKNFCDLLYDENSTRIRWKTMMEECEKQDICVRNEETT